MRPAGTTSRARIRPNSNASRKFYSAIPAQVEFRPFSPEAARAQTQILAKQAGLQLGFAELALLLEATGGDVARIAIEVEKLRLYVGLERKVTAEDIAALVPDAAATTIFVLVAALGRGDRVRALQILDTLAARGRVYAAGALFPGDAIPSGAGGPGRRGLRGAGQIQAHFTKLGTRMWNERARQIEQTVQAFPKERLERAVVKFV